MIERAFAFGPESGLIGILTEPEHGRERAGAPAVVLANVGVNHRVGPYRLWVTVARRLAEAGYRTLRLDLSGLGDSAPRRDSRTELERANADMEEAMNFVTSRRGTQSFVLMGLCSGVDSVHAVSVRDSRVVGAVWMDGYAYRTPGFNLRHYSLRFLQRGRWKRYILRRLATVRPSRREAGEAPEIYTREYPSQAQLSRELVALTARGAKLLSVYSGDANLSYNHAGQFFDMFPDDLRGKVEEEFYERADHTFSIVADRDRLVSRLVLYMERHFPGQQAAGAR